MKSKTKNSIKKKIIFLGSKPIGLICLTHLIENINNFNIEIVGVLTNNNNKLGTADIIGLCSSNNIPIIKNLNDIIKLDCDFLISIQFHKILKKKHIDTAKIMAINLHMAPLPDFRGCNQFTFAIINKKEEFGTTIHLIDEEIDNGPILAENRFMIPKEITVNELFNLTFKSSIELFSNSIEKILNNKLVPINQNKLVHKRGTSLYFRKDIEKVKKIDLNWPKEKIWRHIRATSMSGFSPPYTIIKGKKIKFILE